MQHLNVGPQRRVRRGFARPRLGISCEEFRTHYQTAEVLVPHVGLPVGEDIGQYHYLGLKPFGAVNCHHLDSITGWDGDGLKGAGATLSEIAYPVR